MTQFSPEAKNDLLKNLLAQLANRGMARRWALIPQPHAALEAECRRLRTDTTVLSELGVYLRANPIIQQSMRAMIAQFAMVANVRWQSVPELQQGLARQGWHVSRWLPTFLIVNGPLGRVLRSADSPLNKALRESRGAYPVLQEARDAFNHETFRLVRNGVGHWSFLWRETSSGSEIVCIHEDTGLPTVTVTLLEAEAMSLLAFSVTEVLDHELFRHATEGNGT